MLFLDLDGFKAVNDGLGHQAGDELLTVVASRLSACLRPGDIAARLGGDEFAVLLDPAGDTTGLAVAERIIASVSAPIDLGGRPAAVAASIGIAAAGPALLDAAALLNAADIAMYQAKRAGKGRAVVFRPTMRAAVDERESLRAELRQALADDAVSVHYQPVTRLDTGEIVAVEALARWTSDTRGPVSPAEFALLAEEAGVLRELGDVVLATAARAVLRWRAVSPGLGLHVSVPARQAEVATFADDLTAVLRRTGLPGTALTLEVTEKAHLSDPAAVHANLAALRRRGCRYDQGFHLTGPLSHEQLDQLLRAAAHDHRPAA